eukprot:6283483-Prorocentrum_lima.AAC.1
MALPVPPHCQGVRIVQDARDKQGLCTCSSTKLASGPPAGEPMWGCLQACSECRPEWRPEW